MYSQRLKVSTYALIVINRSFCDTETATENISSQKHSSEGKTKTNAILGSISATLHEIYQLLSIDDYLPLDKIEVLYLWRRVLQIRYLQHPLKTKDQYPHQEYYNLSARVQWGQYRR